MAPLTPPREGTAPFAVLRGFKFKQDDGALVTNQPDKVAWLTEAEHNRLQEGWSRGGTEPAVEPADSYQVKKQIKLEADAELQAAEAGLQGAESRKFSIEQEAKAYAVQLRGRLENADRQISQAQTRLEGTEARHAEILEQIGWNEEDQAALDAETAPAEEEIENLLANSSNPETPKRRGRGKRKDEDG